MGRATPAASFSSSTIPTTPPLSLPLTIMAFASTITIIFTLCMSHHRKSTTPKSAPSLPSKQSIKTLHVKPPSLTSKQSTKTPNVVPPPPPSPPSPPIQIQKQKQEISIMGPLSPKRRLYVSMSMRSHKGYLSKIRSSTRRERYQKRKAFFVPEAAEDSVWSKKIILGERCRVPSDDDDEEFVMYDENGNRRRNYHPKAPRSLPVSRTNSFVVDGDLASPAKVASFMFGGFEVK